MAVSQAELRLLITAQDRAKAVVEGAAQTIGRVTQAVNQLGQTRGFQMAADGARQLGSAVQQLSQGSNVFGQMTQAAQRFAQAAQQASQQARAAGTGDFLNPKQASGQAGAAAMNSAMTQIQAAFQRAREQAAQASGAISQSLMSIGNAARGVAGGVSGGLSAAFNGLSSLTGGITGVAGRIGELVRSAGGLQAASGNVNTFSSSLRNMAALGATIVGLQGAVGVVTRIFDGLKEAAIGFNSTLENTQNAFTSLFSGDATKAAAFIQQLRQVAESTAFEFPDLLKMSQQLVGVGLAAEQVIPLMKDVAGAMTAAGRTTADVNRVSRALQQVFTTGRVQADEMNQLAEAGVPGWRILGTAIQQSGESMEAAIGRARELGKQGKISAADFFNAFQAYSRTAGWREMAENAVNTFTGAVSNLKDSFRFLVSDATQPAFLAMSAGIQNFSKLLMSTPVRQFALDIGATLKDVMASFSGLQQAFGRIFEGFKAGGVTGVLQSIVAELTGFAGSMQDAGAQLMMEYASGIITGAGDAIQAAIDFVVDLIASFLIGQSPPPAGPLAQIGEGGRNVALEWLAGLSDGFQGVESVVVGIADAFGNVSKELTLTGAETAFEGAKGSLIAMGQVAEDVEGALRNLNASQRELDREQGALQSQQENIKSYYGEQVDALERSIAAVKEQNTEAERYADLVQKQTDAISRQADLRDRAALNELKAAQIAAEGDPVKRATLVAEQAGLKAQEQDLQLAQRAHDLAQRQEALDKRRSEGKKGASATDARDIELAQQRINLDMRQLETERKLAGLTDKQALANIDARRSEIERASALRKVEEDRARMATEAVKSAAEIERAERAILALPLEQQLEAVKKEQEDALRPVQQRLGHLQQEERALQAIRKEWQAIKAAISDAEQAQKATETAGKKAAKGGGKPGFAGGAMNLDTQEIDLSIVAERVGNSFAGKFGEAVSSRIGPILFGTLGAVLGGATFGPLGLVAGAAFGAQVGAGLQSRIPDLATIIGDIGRTFMQAFGGDWEPDSALAPAINAAGMLGIAFRTAADIIAAAWEALKGPVAAGAQWIREHSGLAAAALTGLLVPAFGLLLSTVGAVIGPIIGLLAPLTPAILAVSAAAVLLKLMWDANFGGIQQTVTAAVPGVIQALQQLGQAFLLLTQGDAAGALSTLGTALQTFGEAVTPILVGIGQAIWEQTKTWALALWEWIKGAAPQAQAALGDFANNVVSFISQNAEPFLRALLGWGRGLVAWVAPMIPPVIGALGTLIDNVLTWIGAQIPGLVQAVTKWAVIFVSWIITDVLPEIPGALLLLGEAIVLGITTLVPRVAEAILNIAVAIGTGFMEGLRTAQPEMAAELEAYWASIGETASAVVATVQGIVASVVEAWNGLPALLQATWDAIMSGVTATGEAIQGAWDGAWQGVLGVWNGIGAAINAAVMAVWNSLSTDTQASLTRMVAAITTLWNALVALAQATWAAIWAAIQTALGVLAALVLGWIAAEQARWQAFLLVLQKLWEALAGIATAAWTAVTDAITKVVAAWWVAAQAVWEIVKTALIAVWEWLATNVGPVVQKYVDMITSTIQSWWETAKGWVAQWQEIGTTWAASLMDALKTGIEKKIQAVAGAITGAATYLTGLIDKALGRESGGGSSGSGPGGSVEEQIAKAAVARGYDPATLIAFARHETGGFQSGLYGQAKNIFSIKGKGPAGSVTMPAWEVVNGKNVMSNETFRKYESDWQSITDFLDMIEQMGNYAEAVANKGNPERFMRGLQAGGYATDPNWATNVLKGRSNVTVPDISRMTASMQGDPGRGLSVIQQKQGEWASMLEDASTICGPYLAALFADAVGRPPSPAEARSIGEAMGVYGRGQGILAAGRFGEFATQVVQKFNPGTTARVQQTAVGGPWDAGQMAQQALGAGAPLVGFNTPKHYFGATAFDPATNKFNTGGTGKVFGNTDPWLTAERIAELGGGMTHIITLAGQMGEGFTAAGMQSSEAMAATTAVVETTGETTERTAAMATQDASLMVSSSTDALGNITAIYSDATGVIGASITNAAGQVVNSWGIIQQAHQNAAATQTEAATRSQAFADQLMAGMVPAGAQAGTAIQQMTASIDPLLSQVAAGTLTTDQLALQLSTLAANAGLTSEPLAGLTAGTLTAQQAMLLMLTQAAAVDPQFALLREQLLGTNADAQTMAVTFAEGVANSTGVAGVALQEMSTHIDPLVERVAAGQIEGDALARTMVQLAAKSGLATGPFRDLENGVATADEAFQAMIRQTAEVGPGFAELAQQVEVAGTVSKASATQFLALIQSLNRVGAPTDQATTAQETFVQQLEAVAPALTEMSMQVTTQTQDALTVFHDSTIETITTTLSEIAGLAETAQESGRAVGTALGEGITAGIEETKEQIIEKARESVAEAIDAMKEEAESDSPSRRTRQLGRDMSGGLGLGFQERSGAFVAQAKMMVGRALTAMDAAAEAGAHSEVTRRLGWSVDAGLEVGVGEEAGSAAGAARRAVEHALAAMSEAADAHSPSEETKELGLNLNAGLVEGQLDPSELQKVKTASVEVIEGSLSAMREAADAHSPSNAAFQIGADIMKGLQDALASGGLGDYAKNAINEYLSVAQNFGSTFAEQVTRRVVELQHQLAVEQNALIPIQQDIAFTEEQIQRATEGTFEQQQRIGVLNVARAQQTHAIATIQASMLPVQVQLREQQEAQARAAAGSLQVQQELVGLNVRLSALAEAETSESQRSLVTRRELSKAEADQEKARAQSLAVRFKEAAIHQRIAAITLEQATADRAILPLRNQIRNVQQQIEDSTRNTVAAQQAAIRADEAVARRRIEILQIEERLAQGERGTSMTQAQINALHERKALLEAEQATSGRTAEIQKLQAEIATSSARQQLVALQEQERVRERAGQPLGDERAILEADQAIISATGDVAASAFDAQIAALNDAVAAHDAVMLAIEQQREGIELQKAALEGRNATEAAGIQAAIVLTQAQVDAYDELIQQRQDVLDSYQAEEAAIDAVRQMNVTAWEQNLINHKATLDAMDDQVRSLERQLELQQGVASAIQTQAAMITHLRDLLVDMGLIEEGAGGAPSPATGGRDSRLDNNAMGGPVWAGVPTVVGENGRELLVPAEDGYILNNATTERLMSVIGQMRTVMPRVDSTLRQQQVGATVWRGQMDASQETNDSSWMSSAGETVTRPQRVVNLTVEYHAHQPVMGETRVEQVVSEALRYAEQI